MSISPSKQFPKAKLILFNREGYLTNEAVQICEELGINKDNLYKKDIQEFKEESQTVNSPSKIQQIRFQHYEQRRQVKINAIKETMKLIREMEQERQKSEQTLKQATLMSVLDLKQNKNKEQQLQEIIKHIGHDQVFHQIENTENKMSTIQTDYALKDIGQIPLDNYKKNMKNQNDSGQFHIKQEYAYQMEIKGQKYNKQRSYSQVRSSKEQINMGNKNNYILNKSSQHNVQFNLNDISNPNIASKSVVLQRAENKKYKIIPRGDEENFGSRNTTLEQSHSRGSKYFLNNIGSITPNNKLNISNSHSNNKSFSSNNMSFVVENLDFDVKLKLVRKIMRMEKNDQKKKDQEQQKQEIENEIKQELEEKKKQFQLNHVKVQKEKEQALKKRMKDQKEHSKLVRMQVKEKQQELEMERIKIKKQQLEEANQRFQLEQQKIKEDEKQSFLRSLERNEEKRVNEQLKQQKYEEQIKKAKDCFEEIEKEQQVKQNKHNIILSQKSKQISQKIEQYHLFINLSKRKNRVKSNLVIREQELETSKSQTIQNLISVKLSSSKSDRKRDVSVFNSQKFNERIQKKQEFEKEKSIKLLDIIKQYDLKSKQAEEYKSQIYSQSAAEKKEQFQLKREGVLENLAIQDYQWNLHRQMEMDKYKQKVELAKMNKNIKDEITFLTQQGVKEMYNIIKKQKES